MELKRLGSEAIPGALAKAERYRLLNEPEQAESICLDILAADPKNREARAKNRRVEVKVFSADAVTAGLNNGASADSVNTANRQQPDNK